MGHLIPVWIFFGLRNYSGRENALAESMSKERIDATLMSRCYITQFIALLTCLQHYSYASLSSEISGSPYLWELPRASRTVHP